MRIDKIIDGCMKAAIEAKKEDEQWRRYWAKPPEYIFTVAIARAISKMFGDSVSVETEKNIDELKSDSYAAMGISKSKKKRAGTRVDICVSGTDALDLWP